MKFSRTIFALFTATASVNAFTTSSNNVGVRSTTAVASTPFFTSDIQSALDKEVRLLTIKLLFVVLVGRKAGVEIQYWSMPRGRVGSRQLHGSSIHKRQFVVLWGEDVDMNGL